MNRRTVDVRGHAGRRHRDRPHHLRDKQYMTELSDVGRQAADQGKCFDQAMKAITRPRYEKWGGSEPFLPGHIQRFCGFWGRGV